MMYVKDKETLIDLINKYGVCAVLDNIVEHFVHESKRDHDLFVIKDQADQIAMKLRDVKDQIANVGQHYKKLWNMCKNDKDYMFEYKHCLAEANNLLTSLISSDGTNDGVWLLDAIEKLIHANTWREFAQAEKRRK